MRKTRTFYGLTVLVLLSTISVTPAAAWFESENGKDTKGKLIAVSTSITDQSATAMVCEKGEGLWSIREHSKQSPAPLGQNLNFGPLMWRSCTFFGFVGGGIKPCEFALFQQTKGAQVAVLSVVTECIIEVSGECEYKIPSGTSNENLTKVLLTSGGTKLEAKVEVSGVTSTATSLGGFGCVGVKNSTNKESTLKSVLRAEGAKVV